jgi:hypothetical protein
LVAASGGPRNFLKPGHTTRQLNFFLDKYKHRMGETDDEDGRGGCGGSGELVFHLRWPTSLSLRVHVWEGSSPEIGKV